MFWKPAEQFFGSAVSVTARCRNSTGLLAEVEARGQRAAAKSDPEVVNSGAVNNKRENTVNAVTVLSKIILPQYLTFLC